MKKIVVNVTTEEKRDNSSTVAIVEVDRGAGWVRLDSKDIVTNMDKDVEFVLRQGERLVLEAYAPETAAYSREQAAAYTPSTQASDSDIDDSRRGEQNAEEKKKRDAEYAAKAGGLGSPNFPKSQATPPGGASGAKTPAQARAEQDAKYAQEKSAAKIGGVVSSKEIK